MICPRTGRIGAYHFCNYLQICDLQSISDRLRPVLTGCGRPGSRETGSVRADPMRYGQVGKIFFSSRQLGSSLAALSAAKKSAHSAHDFFLPGRPVGEGGREGWTFVPLLCALWAGSPEVVVGRYKWAVMAMKGHV